MSNSRNQKVSKHLRWFPKETIYESNVDHNFKTSRFKQRRIHSSPSDFWIPVELAPLLQSKISKYGSLKKVLHVLLEEKRNRLHSLFRLSKYEKTLYQSKGLDLMRFSFRPDSADWAELRLAARYYGVSICRFFVMLLSLLNEKKEEHKDQFSYKREKFGIVLVQKIFQDRNRISFSIFLNSSLINRKRRRPGKI
ncbi:DUF1564 family protein [Leptospira gomenensis]|uniref:DUF1564 family protein n=1 Tax=Leptospira gomenensis TaxID=2484974 RepID=A0A5F1YA44_9LEPT|nr:DUF1564 family protein [Leptospira gomenensis]TGK33688.1 DUF1564 family protein [Leptospira gomenensis]TGK40432.1 DUF1564 family protein [Leptospira gomenensis]TGK65970.1 DUF1564 family protein [Leptospira gomenensis]